MCLAVPMKVLSRDGEMGKVEQDGVARDVSFAMVPEAEVGDYVLIHAGFAIERLDQQQAADTLALLNEMWAEDEPDPRGGS